MKNKIPQYLSVRDNDSSAGFPPHRTGMAFIDKTLLNVAGAVKEAYLQAESAEGKSFIYKINPYIKVISLIYLAIILSLTSTLHGQLAAAFFVFFIFFIAGFKKPDIFLKIFTIALFFGLFISLPASLNIITPGKIIIPLISFSEPVHLWIYNIPDVIGITDSGIQVVIIFFLRILNTVAFTMLSVFTTPLNSFIKSFRIIGIPDTFLLIITLAYKYIFILTAIIEETYFALKSRLTGHIKSKGIRELIGSRIFFIFRRSASVYENTYMAMLSRGYGGNVKLHSEIKLRMKDLAAMSAVIIAGIIVFTI